MKIDGAVLEVMAPDVKYEIFKTLERAAETDAENITVEVHQGKVILRGNVTTWAERETAKRSARKTARGD